MSVLNTPRFRLNRGRVMGFDLANLVTRKVLCTGDGKVPYFDIGAGATPGTEYPASGEEHGLVLQNLHLVRGSVAAATTDVFIGGRQRDSAWKLLLWDESNDAGAEASGDEDKTTDAQDDTAALDIVSGVLLDGFVIASSHTFDTMLFYITQEYDKAVTDGFTYWNGASWAALTVRDSTNAAGGGAADGHFRGEDEWNHIRFEPPGDWAKTTGLTNDEGGVGSGYYAVRYQVTVLDAVGPQVVKSTKARIGSTLRLCILNIAVDEEVLADNMNSPITSDVESPWLWNDGVLAAANGDGDAAETITVAYTAEKTNFAGNLGK